MTSSREHKIVRLRADAAACYADAVRAVAPAELVARALTRTDAGLVLHDASGQTIATHDGPVVLVGGGKAALAMARQAASAIGSRLTGGVIVVPHGGSGEVAEGVLVRSGAHPLPDGAGVAATARLLSAVEGATHETLVLCVLSGGASALLSAPAAGLLLADKQTVTERLLAAGADITALNLIRKHCSRIKGGGLARAAASTAGVWTLVLSDVVGDDLATIASGPTVPDPSTFAEALAALNRWLPDAAAPAAIRTHLERGAGGRVPDTLKPGHSAFARTQTLVVGGNGAAVEAAAAAARARGYQTEVVAEPFVGDAATVGRRLANRLLRAAGDRPIALIAGGETTVRAVVGGRGGRNQHLALAASVMLRDQPAVLLAAGTDGIDGPTDAAGGCVDGYTVARAATHGFDAAWALAATDSHTVLRETGDLLPGGATGTNVADVVVALWTPC